MENIYNLNNITMKNNTVEKRKATILRKRQKKEASKAAYYEKHKTKIDNRNEAKAILQAGEFYSSLFNNKLKSYFINCKIDYRMLWYGNKNAIYIDDDNANKLTHLYFNKYNKQIFSIYKDPQYYYDDKKKIPYNEIVNKSMYGQYIETTEFSKTYYASDTFQLKKLMTEEIYYLYEANDQYKRQDILDIYDIKILENVKEEKNKKFNIAKMKMKEAFPLKYPELVGHIEDELKNDGFCVFNNFLTEYEHIKEDEFIKLCSEVEPVIKEDGISSEQLYHVCKKKDISLYAFDITKKCFLKYVSKNRNYKALVYYAINNHMYLVNNEIAQSLIKTAVDIETKINSIYFDDEYEEAENIFDKLEIKENIDIKELLTYDESCIVIYPTKNLNQQLIDLMNNNIKPYIKRCKKTLITNMIINKSKTIKFYLFSDENDQSQNINFKKVKDICEKEEIEFKNQTFTSVITQIKNKIIKQKQQRINFTKDFRKEFFQNNKLCNNKECNIKLKKGDREIDHIIPLSQGGTNDLENLQALCKECHFDKTQDDITDENINISKTHSSFSNVVSKVLESNLNKSLAFVEKIKHIGFEKSPLDFGLEDDEDDTKSASLDINGCRRNILRFNEYDYPLFTCLDSFTEYNGQTTPGLYYVESDNYMPLRGNGFYYYPVIKYCLDNNIINESDIKYCLLSSLVTPHNYFNDFIDYCVDNIEDSKLAINSLIGSFAISKDNKFWKSLLITENLDEARELFFNSNGVFINMQESERGIFYNVFQEYNSLNMETERIIYDMIVQMEAVEMHKLRTIIDNKGGQITEYKTDCIRFNYNGEFPFKLIDDKNIDEFNYYKYDFPFNEKIEEFYYPDGNPKYKVEDSAELKIELKKQWVRKNTYSYIKSDFNIINDVEDNNFQPLVEQILNLNGCFIEGIAGSGKSYLINCIVEEIKNKGMDVNLLTPTNLSAIIIGGMTLDKFNKKLKSVEILKNLVKDYIIIDEVSMMKEIFYKMLSVIKMYKPSVKIILVGHSLQFSPVKDRIGDKTTDYYFNSDIFKELVHSNKLILTKCRRSDNKHFNNCCNVNNVNINDYGKNIEDFNICYTNVKRIQINKLLMNKAKEKNKIKKLVSLELPKFKYSKISQDVYLTIGTPIMSIKNVKKLNFVNSEMFTIKKIDKNEEIITISNLYSKSTDCAIYKDIDIPFKKFQNWFHVAYCITSHKSQGQTINKPYSIHDWDRMDETCKYVSLSRASKFEYVNIIA